MLLTCPDCVITFGRRQPLEKVPRNTIEVKDRRGLRLSLLLLDGVMSLLWGFLQFKNAQINILLFITDD